MRNHKECCCIFWNIVLGFGTPTYNVYWLYSECNGLECMIQWKTKSFRHFSFRLPYVEESFFFLLFLHNLMLSIISCVRVDWRDSQMDHKYYLVTWCQVHWLNHIHIDVCACLMLVCLCLCIFVCCFFRARIFRGCVWVLVLGGW